MSETRVSRRHILKGAGIAGAASLGVLGPNAILARASGDDEDNALIGAWLGSAELTGLPPSFGALLSFAAGGVLVHSTALDLQNVTPNNTLSTPSYGAWKHTDDGRYAVKFAFFTFDARTNPSGHGEVRQQLTVHGDDLTGALQLKLFNSSGTVIFANPGSIKATRIKAG